MENKLGWSDTQAHTRNHNASLPRGGQLRKPGAAGLPTGTRRRDRAGAGLFDPVPSMQKPSFPRAPADEKVSHRDSSSSDPHTH